MTWIHITQITQQQQEQHDNSSGSIILAGSGNIGLQIVPGTVMSEPMDAYLHQRNSNMRLSLPKAVMLSQFGLLQPPYDVSVELQAKGASSSSNNGIITTPIAKVVAGQVSTTATRTKTQYQLQIPPQSASHSLQAYRTHKASDYGSNSLGHLISLFVERSHQLWKAADVLQWLQTAATAAADVADGKQRVSAAVATPQPKPVSAMTPDDVIIEGTAEDWACVAKESFPAAGRNEYGHLRLADFSDAVNALPQEEMQAVMGPAGGPAAAAAGMNPEAAMDILNDMLEQEQLAAVAAAAQRGQGAPAMSPEELRATNPLLMLLQSLLPWVNAGEQPDYAAGAAGGTGAGNGDGGAAGNGGEQGQPPQGQ